MMLLLILLAALVTTSTPVGVEGRANAEPSIAARGDVVAVVWAATKNGATDVFSAVSADSGRTFAAPVRVNDTPGEANVSGEQAPRVQIVARAGEPSSIVVVWTAKGGSGTRLLSSESADGGRTFSRAAVVPGSDAKGNRGWESTATDAQGRVVAAWLDHRELAEQAPMAHHDGQMHTGHGDTDGAARAQLSKLYVARLGDRAAQAVVSGVCYCCKTALTAGVDGTIFAAWRHVYPGNVRDIAFTLSRDGGRTFLPPVRVSNDDWVLDGCPENGPSIAVDAHGTVHIVWPTLVKGSGADDTALALFYSTTRDGRTFTARTRIPTHGTPRHPQVAVNASGRILVTWDEQLAGSRRVVVDEMLQDEKAGVRFSNLMILDSARNDYPVVAGVERGFAIAYTSATKTDSTIRVSHVK